MRVFLFLVILLTACGRVSYTPVPQPNGQLDSGMAEDSGAQGDGGTGDGSAGDSSVGDASAGDSSVGDASSGDATLDAGPCVDTDSDTVCDGVDLCPGFDDTLDADSDGVPDGCDVCAGFDDSVDTDSDGVPNGCDVCASGDDNTDTDSDGVADACDQCAGFDDSVDTDTDTVPDGCDLCAGSDDAVDADSDGVPDGCDICTLGDDSLDADSDGVPDACDLCAGFDDSVDTDSDGVPDGCDLCAGSDDAVDADSDGVPDGCDVCSGSDDSLDGDSDGTPTGCDCNDTDPLIFPRSTATEVPFDGDDMDCDGNDFCTDLNCDGQVDLVAVDYRSDGSSYDTNSFVFFNTGSGYSDGNRTALPTEGAKHVSVADLDEDGYQDIIFANYLSTLGGYTQTSFVYWGGASGYSTGARLALITHRTEKAYAKDLDNDGHLDLIFVGYTSKSWTNQDSATNIYWGDGTRTGFTTGVNNPTTLEGNGPVSANFADFDTDGDMDIFLCSNRYSNGTSTGYITTSFVYWGDGTQTGYSSAARTSLPSRGCNESVIADLDGDSDLDIVSPNRTSNDWGAPASWDVDSYIFWNDESKPANDPTRFSSANRKNVLTHGTRGVSVADLDNDTHPDLVFPGFYVRASSGGPPTVAANEIYMGAADGTRYNTNVTLDATDQLHFSSTVEDLDSDGFKDIIFSRRYRYTGSNNFETTSDIYWGSGTGYSSLNKDSLATKGAFHSVVADINRDGYPEIIFDNSRDNTGLDGADTRIYWGSATGYSDALPADYTDLDTSETYMLLLVGDGSW